jgi:hypothetical protein
MLKITKASDPIQVQAVNIVIYGQPGAGKTSIAGAAKSALLLDFDRGSHRSAFRPDAVRIEHWNEVAQLTKQDLEGYSTLALDTGGRALDFLAAAMPATEGKTQLKRPSGGLTLQGFGRLKDEFGGWLRRINTFGLDVLIICHDKEDKDGDSRIIRPDITGGSYAEILKLADFCGYLYKGDQNRSVLDFNPTQAWIGKNSAQLPPLVVPHFAEEPQWFAGVIDKMKAALGNVAQAQKEAVDKLGQFREQVDLCATAEQFNELIAAAGSLGNPLRLQAWNILRKAAEGTGLVYDKAAKAFSKPAPVDQAAGA